MTLTEGGVDTVFNYSAHYVANEWDLQLPDPSFVEKRTQWFEELKTIAGDNEAMINSVKKFAEYIDTHEREFEEKSPPKFIQSLSDYLIYSLSTPHLRGVTSLSQKEPLGIHGENLDVAIANLSDEEQEELRTNTFLISWLSDFQTDIQDIMKLKGYKPNRTSSRLYFQDRFMDKSENLFSSENANEGILYLLFYLTLFISNRTPKIFAIDNIENALNPHLCTKIMEIVSDLAIKKQKQVLITTHNPAILDGLDLNNDDIRLFEVYRDDAGTTKTRRIKLNPESKPAKFKLSELWMRGYLGGISKNF